MKTDMKKAPVSARCGSTRMQRSSGIASLSAVANMLGQICLLLSSSGP